MNVMNTLPVSATVLADLTELNTDLVTPGVLGFLVIFGIALVLYFLMRSMTSKLTPLAEKRKAEKAARSRPPRSRTPRARTSRTRTPTPTIDRRGPARTSPRPTPHPKRVPGVRPAEACDRPVRRPFRGARSGRPAQLCVWPTD